MEFVILGPTALHVDGQRIDIGGAKQRAFLGALLYWVGEAVPVDRLVELLWGDSAPPDRRANLYPFASRIRSALRRAGVPSSLVRLPAVAAYRLDIDPDLVDFHRFRQLVEVARNAAARHDHDHCARLLTEAIGLWRNEPLPDLRGARAEHIREHLNDLHLDAQKALAECYLQSGRPDSARTLLEPLVFTHELDEVLAGYWISTLDACGRHDEANRFYATFRRRYRQEFGSETAIDPPEWFSGRPAATPAIPTTGPPVAAAVPNQLPRDISDFTGHEDLLHQLDDPGTNVTVLSGMPGVGKTTLATHWAHRRRDRFPDGQLYLDAQAYGPLPPVTPEVALGKFIQSLDVPADRIPATVDERRDRLNRLLADRHMLIFIDNAGSSDQVRPLIPTADHCTVIITSRRRLNGLALGGGVRNLTVPGLPDAECRDLLREIIRDSRPDAEPDAISALARRSGGLPLALRILGERVNERPETRIAELVDDLTAYLLDSTDEDDQAASLRTVFSWSIRALNPDAARLFRFLGCFPGSSISAPAAAALLGDPEPPLTALARAHLINRDSGQRYRFHDLLRRYAADRARVEETPETLRAAMRRLLNWYLLTAVSAATQLAPHRSAVPDLPEPNGVHPLAFATDGAAMSWCEQERANLGAMALWANRNGLHRYAWQIPAAIHEVFERFGREYDMLELHRMALVSAERDGHPIGQLASRNNLAAIHWAFHNYRIAAEQLEAALELTRNLQGTDAETLTVMHNTAYLRLKAGDIDTAVRMCEDLVVVCRRVDNPAVEAAALHRLGDANRQLKRCERAVDYYREALAIRERLGAWRYVDRTHVDLAAVHLEMGQVDLAQEHCQQALAINQRTHDNAALCDALTTTAEVQLRLGAPARAIENVRRTLTVAEQIADHERRCRALIVLAEGLAVTGDIATAHRAATEALGLLDEMTDLGVGLLRDRVMSILRSRED